MSVSCSVCREDDSVSNSLPPVKALTRVKPGHEVPAKQKYSECAQPREKRGTGHRPTKATTTKMKITTVTKRSSRRYKDLRAGCGGLEMDELFYRNVVHCTGERK